MLKIKFSIVTIVYNGEKEIETTIQSTINQTYKDIEFIIIDGNSKDNTVSIINNYINKIDYFISENDKGIYDAMNKGLEKATGDFVIFMNAGDIFYDINVLYSVSQQITDKDKVYFGRANICDNKNKWLYPNNNDSTNIYKWLNMHLPNHQAMFFPRSFYKNNNYNLYYKVGGDSDYKYRSIKFNGYNFMDLIICNFYLDGISNNYNDLNKLKIMLQESWKLLIEHRNFLYAINGQLKLILKYLLSKLKFIQIIRSFK